MNLRQPDPLASDVVIVLIWTEPSCLSSLLFLFFFFSAASYVTWREPFQFGAHVTSFHPVYLGHSARRTSLEFQ